MNSRRVELSVHSDVDKLTGMDTTKGTLDFRYPPGSAEWTR
jgi:hypothetical protein